jgi:hypothetical protein
MLDIPTWEVTLFVYGPIATKRLIQLNEPKGFELGNDPFYSDIKIERSSSGIKAEVSAYASTEELAYKAALLFFGQMLDVLALKINLPLYLSLYDRKISLKEEAYKTRRIVTREEWRTAFREARLLALSETTYLRALGWYRKGLHTEDPFDKFLAFWNSIEIVTNKYHPPIPSDKATGSKSKIWESFKKLWGDCKNWPVIPGQTKWIDDNNEIRNKIAHGTQPIDIETIDEVIKMLDDIQKVAYEFIVGWRENELEPQIPRGLEKMFGY